MKKLLWLSVALLTSTALFVGCQKQLESELDDMTDGAKKGSISRYAAGTATCANGDCIEIGEESAATSTPAAYNPSKSVTVSITNDDNEVIFRFSSAENIHYIKIGDVQKFCSATDNNGNPINQATYEIRMPIGTFQTDWQACENRTYAITIYRNNCTGNGEGNAVTFNASHQLVPVCVCDEELLSYETEDNLNIVFSYNDDEALTGATVVFTFPQVLNLPLTDGKYVAPDGKIYTVNNPDNQTVFTWMGDLPCRTEDAETFAFSMMPDCDGEPSNDGKANIWTDFKVNGESKKGTNVNIVYTGCPVNP